MGEKFNPITAMLEEEKKREALKLSASEYAKKMNAPAEMDREALAASVLTAALPALLGYAHKGSTGLALGAQAGAVGAGGIATKAAENAKLEREAAKIGYKETQGQLEDTDKRVQDLQMKNYNEKKQDEKDSKADEYRKGRDAKKDEASKIQDEQDGKEENRRNEDKAQKIMELQVPGASMIPGKRPLVKQATEFSNVVETTSVLENSINQLKSALKSEDLETARLAYSDITFQLKKKYNLGANFTESEQFLNSLQLPTFAKDYTLGEFNTLVKGKLRAENVDTVMDNLLNKTRGDAKIAGITRGYYLHNYQYSPEEASKYKIKLGKNGLAEQDDTGVQNLLSGFANGDTSSRLLGNKPQQPNSARDIITSLPADRQASIMEKVKQRLADKQQVQ